MKRHKHSLSHYKLLTCNMGELVPLTCFEVLPGDTMQMATSLLLRTSPLLTPVMHPVHMRIHHWYVPTRLIWADWENFITGGPDGLNASTPPTITPNTGSGYAVGSLADYLAVPTGVDDLPHSALPFRAYGKIFNEFYRDEQLQTAITVSTASGADTTTGTSLQNVCWEKDYFTSSRPTAQLGAAVSLPLGTQATVKTSGSTLITGAAAPLIFRDSAGGAITADKAFSTGGSGNIAESAVAAAGLGAGVYPNNLYADLSTATAATINDLRAALALQKYEEARNLYGSRYTEYLRYLGIRNPSDARLQRPEYLGGGRQTIQFSEVLQTANTTSGTPGTGVGTMLGHGIGAVRSNRYRRFFEEHGWVISLLSVLPRTMYVQGLPRAYSRATKTDYYQKEFEHIGQQQVLNKEVYWAHGTPNGTFGYQDRYDEYRRIESSVSGDFRTTLNMWHLARVFSSDPALNSTFVSSNPATRIFQSTASDQLYIMANHNIQARRMLSHTGGPRGLA